MWFFCDRPGCTRRYKRKEHLVRHAKDHESSPSFTCSTCPARFTRKDTLRRHELSHQLPETGDGSRVPIACNPCRRAKSKCDGQRPVCSSCVRKVQQCDWVKPQNQNEIAESQQPLPEPNSADQDFCDSSLAELWAKQPVTFNPNKKMVRRHFESLYFEKFHPLWPILHWQAYQDQEECSVLSQVVVTVGLWLSQEPQNKTLVRDLYRKLIIGASNTVLAMMSRLNKSERLSRLNEKFLSFLQSVMILLAFFPCLQKDGLGYALMTHTMFTRMCNHCGVYNQVKIDQDCQSIQTEDDSALLQQSYQRIGFFQCKLYIILYTVFISGNPNQSLSRVLDPTMLEIYVPLKLEAWDCPTSMLKEHLSASMAESQVTNEARTVREICENAIASKSMDAVAPLKKLDIELGEAIGHWCIKGTKDKMELIESWKPLGLEHLRAFF